ncbi:expressed unknown protein [Seminavis robusta]|uniref:Endonuclease/exonuclease/phosphatase domain-containing protein n=1 Tax=Seminavis robusta TaxID=568900 RepID=A0A9N8F377_9STRA|nr:expressed unknown protein [Seminavis robusta]|eukprot:Sro3008_g342030.1 n/a (493) ;mRNA; f:1259-2737
MQDMQVDISMLVETKLDTAKQYVRSRLKEDATQSFGHKDAFKLNAHSTPIKADKSRKPGGILQLTTGHHQGRIMDQGKDEFGRWVYTTYRCKGESPRTVITTYQVVKTDPYTSGPTTYATQLFGLYTKEGRQEPHNLRKHHANDLVSFVQDLQSKGHLVMVAGDFNTDLGEEEGGLDHLCSECNLIDPILTTHGAANFSTYNRGKNILDYILIDPELLPTIVRCGYEAFHAHVISDHRGVYIDVDTDLFFGDDPQVLVRKQARDIISTKAHQIGPYFDNKHQHLEDHNWFEQIKTLQQHMRDNIPNHTLAEQLYDRLLTACIYAGKRLPKYRDAPYSPELVRLRTIKDLLNTVYSHMTTNIDLSDQIENIRNKLDSVGYDLPTSVEECKKAQRQATKDFTTAMKEELKNKPLRKAHLKQLIKDAREKEDKKLVKALKHIQRAEDSNTIFDKLRIIRNKVPSGGLKHFLVPENPQQKSQGVSTLEASGCPRRN